MSGLDRFRQWRLENAEDAAGDARARLGNLKDSQRRFGGRHARIREAERVFTRRMRRLDRLHPAAEKRGKS